MISKGYYFDRATIKIINKDFFKPVDPRRGVDFVIPVKEIPKQLPQGVKLEEMEDMAKSLTQSSLVLTIVQLAIQLMMKGSMERFLDIYYELEIQKGVLFFDHDIPINVQTYLNEVMRLVDFEALKPHNLLALIGNEEE